MASSEPPVVTRSHVSEAAAAASGPVRVAAPSRPTARSPRARAAGARLDSPLFHETASTGILRLGLAPRGGAAVPRRAAPSPSPPSPLRSVSTVAARRRRPPRDPSLPSPSPSPPPPAAVPAVDAALLHGVSSRQGLRPTMEDYHVATTFKSSLTSPLVGIYAVFDGHGGQLAAQTAAAAFVPALTTGTCHFPDGDLAAALTATTARCEDAVLEASRGARSYAGSTLAGLVVRRAELMCVNVGDSRVVLGRRGGTVALALSVDHSTKLEGETERITGAGGFVENGKVMGLLATTRSLGDMDFKEHRGLHYPSSSSGLSGPLITATPDITRTVLEEGDDFAILACDGLWSVLANKAAVRLAARALRRYNDPSAAADALVRSALARGSTDNVTVVLVALKWTPRTHSPVFGGMFSLHGGSSTESGEASAAATGGVSSLRNGMAALASLRGERSADEKRNGGWRRRVGLRGPPGAHMQ